MSQTARTDGSAEADARELVVIDRDDTADRMRYRCPNGHTRWDPTNNHVWCKSCSEAAQQGADVHPEHWEILDKKTGEEIPWSAIEFL